MPAPTAPNPPELSPLSFSVVRVGYGDLEGLSDTPLLRGEIRWSLSDDMSNPTSIVDTTDLSTPYDVRNLSPGRRYFFQIRVANVDGWSEWSGVSVTTTPNVDGPVGLDVTFDNVPRGSARVQTSAPSGVRPDSYVWQYAIRGTGMWQVKETAQNTTVIDGLDAGAMYDFRVAYRIGDDLTLGSNVNTIQIPLGYPRPGDPWAGSTTDSEYVNYEWFGGANDSRSTATGYVPLGWIRGTEVTATSGGTIRGIRANVSIDIGTEMLVTGEHYAVWTAPDQHGVRMGTDATTHGATVTAGATYVGSAYVRASKRRGLAAQIMWYNNAATFLGLSNTGAVTFIEEGGTGRVSVLAVAPEQAAYAGVIVTDPEGTEPILAGDWFEVSGVMLSQGLLYPYFDGDTPNTPEHFYAWIPNSRGRYSRRTDTGQTIDDRNPLLDPDCPPVPEPPRPPAAEAECLEEVTAWNRYWMQVSEQDVSGWSESVPTVTITTGSAAERQVRIRYYENPRGLAPEQFDGENWTAEQIISYIPPNTVFTVDGVSERAWASVDGGPELPADSLLFGTGGVPASWPVLRCGISWIIAVDTPATSDPGNISVELQLTRRS